MQLLQLIIILSLLCFGIEAKAQIAQDLRSMPDQWQLSVDVIKSKAQSLVVQNNDLNGDYQKLISMTQKLQQSITEEQKKNDQLVQFLKERHGRSDQQMRMDELMPIIKNKQKQAQDLDGQLVSLQQKKAMLDGKIQQLKMTISDIQLHQQAEKQKPAETAPKLETPTEDAQFAQLRKQLEDETRQEVLLEDQESALKASGDTKNLNADAINEENKQLEAQLDFLRLQKLRHEKNNFHQQVSESNARTYAELKKRKDMLEAKIYAYAMRMDQMKQSSLIAMSWPLKKKKLVHDMVQIDARNNQMRDKIKSLHEDIDVLRDQVAKLERRLNFAQGKVRKS